METTEITFKGVKIGITDRNGSELFNGDIVTIEVTKDVNHKGRIVYDYGSFCLKVPRGEKDLFLITPLRNYASYCQITKIMVDQCPNCESNFVDYDDSDGFFECSQCDNNWI